MISLDRAWIAIVSCEGRYDGVFWYGVATTGIYCRPSCKSRTPNRENVRIYTSAENAAEAGFRPCKRCRPEEIRSTYSPRALLAEEASEWIRQHYQENLTLEQLAKHLYVSPFYLQKAFKGTLGISPAQFINQVRIEEAKKLLLQGKMTVTEIAHQVGYRSAAHFSSLFRQMVQATPTDYRGSMFTIEEGVRFR